MAGLLSKGKPHRRVGRYWVAFGREDTAYLLSRFSCDTSVTHTFLRQTRATGQQSTSSSQIGLEFSVPCTEVRADVSGQQPCDLPLCPGDTRSWQLEEAVMGEGL